MVCPMAAVQCWTGTQTKALRQAMRLSVRAFAEHLGVDARTVNNWEARGGTITLLPDTQALMDTALSRATEEVKTRFIQTVDSTKQEQTAGEARLVEPAHGLPTGPASRADSLAIPLPGGNDGITSSPLLTELARLTLAHVTATPAVTTSSPPDREVYDDWLVDHLRSWATGVNRREAAGLLGAVACLQYCSRTARSMSANVRPSHS